MKKLLILPVVIATVLGTVGMAHAQTIIAPLPPQPIQTCSTLTHNLSYGTTDSTTGGEVTVLQIFLNQNGYLNTPPVGIFGPLTRAAVITFQHAQGLPAFGYVGPMTRPIIHTISCGTTTNTLSISSISPSAGAVGTAVTVRGSGFTQTGNIVMFGGGALSGITSRDGNVLTFEVPNATSPYCPPMMACTMMARLITPGAYPVSIKNANGDSNAIIFTVTGAGNSNSPTISGIDAPARLSLGQSGTWTVHVTVPNSADNEQLHYSVVWGDEVSTASQGIMAPTGPITAQTTATFTHSYNRSGTFTPSFTVSDDFGNSTATSVMITVDPLY